MDFGKTEAETKGSREGNLNKNYGPLCPRSVGHNHDHGDEGRNREGGA